MSEPAEARAWVHRAEEDWLLARAALRRKVHLIYKRGHIVVAGMVQGIGRVIEGACRSIIRRVNLLPLYKLYTGFPPA
jgi:hypothetical protein